MFRKITFTSIFVLIFTNYLSAISGELKVLSVESFGSQRAADITKLYDSKERVLCYVLSPAILATNMGMNGTTYDGNSVGSISCVKSDLVK